MSAPGDTLTQWLVFVLAGREYGVPVERVGTVLRMVALTALPESPPWIAGLLNLHGKSIVTIDLRHRLGLPEKAPDLTTQIVVLETDACPFAVLADEVLEIIKLPQRVHEPAEQLAGASPLLSGVLRAGERLILVLDVDHIGQSRSASEGLQ